LAYIPADVKIPEDPAERAQWTFSQQYSFVELTQYIICIYKAYMLAIGEQNLMQNLRVTIQGILNQKALAI
jgi:hypothetical protein